MSDNLRIGQTQKQIEHEDVEKMRNALIDGRLNDIQRFERFNELDLIGQEEDSESKFGGYWGRKFRKKTHKVDEKECASIDEQSPKISKINFILYWFSICDDAMQELHHGIHI
ncbi:MULTISPECIES: hypothetical protein [Staphylococcus]|uniref:hypothetical protein n=1 Tax=Staphylococcus TaxID=1279 RepID=UPI0021A8CC16|nr:hypothetical protein [Staphylococcus epidermidis]MCT1513143.1 hypothetical protein [Staphylococcus epidermidis]